VAAWLLCLAPGCSDDRQVDGLIAQLRDPLQRERAIEGLMVAVRGAPASRRAQTKQRVVYALMEAYRQDSKRGQIVTALALLRSKKAEQVFVAAMGDAERGGEYFEAAIRSARLLGELGIRRQAPALIKALEKAHAKPREDRNTWLERTLIRALGRLGDPKATDVLIKVLRTKPGRQDFFLNKLAARSLGQLRAKRAAPDLVRSLGATAHGLLLFEASRRALCRIGAGAREALLKAATKPGAPGGAAAMRVLGDLGDATVLRPLTSSDPPWPRDANLTLAWAETLLRLGHWGAASKLAELVKSPEASLTTRRRAAELLGWYGGAPLGELLTLVCHKDGQASAVLCWAVALALTRQGGADDLALFDKVAKEGDETTRQYLQRYRPRLAMAARCKAAGCLQKQLGHKDWRVRERAALNLGQEALGSAAVVASLARAYPGEEHPQVKQAILTSLEQLALRSRLPAGLADTLGQRPKRKRKGGQAPAAAQRSRMICLGQRLERNQKGSK